MTTYTLTDATQADVASLAAENARLRLAVAHLATHGRAVLDCRDNGAITLAQQGVTAYQASHALAALDECVARALAGDWQPLSAEQRDAAWARWSKHPLWGEEYLTRYRWDAAIADLLWHPERQTAAHPPHRPCGRAECAPSFAGSSHVLPRPVHRIRRPHPALLLGAARLGGRHVPGHRPDRLSHERGVTMDNNIITYLPRSSVRMLDAAKAAVADGCRLYHNGRALVAAPRKPGPGWFRVGVRVVDRRAAA